MVKVLLFTFKIILLISLKCERFCSKVILFQDKCFELCDWIVVIMIDNKYNCLMSTYHLVLSLFDMTRIGKMIHLLLSYRLGFDHSSDHDSNRRIHHPASSRVSRGSSMFPLHELHFIVELGSRTFLVSRPPNECPCTTKPSSRCLRDDQRHDYDMTIGASSHQCRIEPVPYPPILPWLD